MNSFLIKYKHGLSLLNLVFIIFILIISLLSNTAFINFNEKGLPLFFLLFPIALIKINQIRIERQLLFPFLFLSICLIVHYYLSSVGGETEVGQYLLNILFALGFLLLLELLNIFPFELLAVFSLVIIGSFFLLDSVFAIVNYLSNSRLTLNYLANNASFGIRINDFLSNYNSKGISRITGPWSEPAYSALPVLTYIFCLYTVRHLLKRNVIILAIFICTLYLFLAGARSFFVLLGALTLFSTFFYLIKDKINFESYSFRQLIVFFALSSISLSFLLFAGSFLDSCQISDMSFATRFGSMEFAAFKFLEHPTLGFGPKGLIEELSNSNLPVCIKPILRPQTAINSLLMQQLFKFGVFSIPFLVFPYFAVAKYSAPKKFPEVLVFLLTLYIVCIFTGDFTLFSGYWFILGLFFLYAKPDRPQKLDWRVNNEKIQGTNFN